MSNRFDIIATPLQGLAVVQRKPLGDARGYLERVFCAEDLSVVFAGRPVSQINHTLTAGAGTVRGMHFQLPPHAEFKLVSCLRGEVFDVAVDLRKGSPSFLQWHAEVLGADNHRSLAIPEGFAHGFQTLTPDCEMLYLHTAPYAPGFEGALNARDPLLGIRWPLPISGLSPRDNNHPMLTDRFHGIDI